MLRQKVAQGLLACITSVSLSGCGFTYRALLNECTATVSEQRKKVEEMTITMSQQTQTIYEQRNSISALHAQIKQYRESVEFYQEMYHECSEDRRKLKGLDNSDYQDLSFD